MNLQFGLATDQSTLMLDGWVHLNNTSFPNNLLCLYIEPSVSYLHFLTHFPELVTQFNDIVNVFFSSPVIVALLVAVFLDNTLTRHVTKKDRGLLWTRKFQVFSHDPRNLEFYRLPMGLHKFFPGTWSHTSYINEHFFGCSLKLFCFEAE